jgi:hypothetical protein
MVVACEGIGSLRQMPKLMQNEIVLIRMRMKPIRYLQLVFMRSPWLADNERQMMIAKKLMAVAILLAVVRWPSILCGRHTENTVPGYTRRHLTCCSKSEKTIFVI